MEKEDKQGIDYVIIPGEVAFNKELTKTDSFVFWMIKSLSCNKENNCWANNEFIANKLNINPQTVSNSIAKLKKLKYIEQISFDGRVRRLAIDKEYAIRYEHLISAYNDPYRQHIPKLIVYKDTNKNYNLSLSKDKEKETKVSFSAIGLRYINKAKLKRLLYTPDISKRTEKIILYWNSQGKPLTVHRLKKGKLISRVDKLIKIKSRSYKMKDFIEAIDLYHELLSSKHTTINKAVSLDQFIEASDYQQEAIYNNKEKASISSWFYECLKGKDYLFKTYGKFIKDKHPDVTEKIKEIWKERIGKLRSGEEYSENSFRIASNEAVRFIGDNRKNFTMDKREVMPTRFVKYIFDAVFKSKDLDKVSPGWLAKDFVYDNILPNYLRSNRFMK